MPDTEQLYQHLAEGRVVALPLDAVGPDPGQPRRTFDRKRLNDLAADIAAHGVLQPITVRRVGDRLCIVMGERRWKACDIAGLESVPAVLSATSPDADSDDDAAVLERKLQQLAENHHRDDLTVMDLAWFLRGLRDDHGLSATSISRVLKERGFRDMGRSYVANTIRLTELPERHRAAITAGELRPSHGKYVLQMQAWGDAALEALDQQLADVRRENEACGEEALPSEVQIRESMLAAAEAIGIGLSPMRIPYEVVSDVAAETGVQTYRLAFDPAARCAGCEHQRTLTVDGITSTFCVDRNAFAAHQVEALQQAPGQGDGESGADPARSTASTSNRASSAEVDTTASSAEASARRSARLERYVRDWLRRRLCEWVRDERVQRAFLLWAACGQPMSHDSYVRATLVPWRGFPCDMLDSLGLVGPVSAMTIDLDSDRLDCTLTAIVLSLDDAAVIAWSDVAKFSLVTWTWSSDGADYLELLGKQELLAFASACGLTAAPSEKVDPLRRRLLANTPESTGVPDDLAAAFSQVTTQEDSA